MEANARFRMPRDGGDRRVEVQFRIDRGIYQ
jgi:hypothetical protein